MTVRAGVKRRERVGTVGHAILGILAREPLSGYDIARHMAERIGFFWSVRRSQVYPELVHLEQAGLVRHRAVRESGRPDKRVYRITDAGREELREWVGSPTRHVVRDEFVLKAYSLWIADPAAAAARFRERAEEHARSLVLYEGFLRELERALGATPGPARTPHFGDLVTLRAGMAYAGSFGAWCTSVVEALERGDHGPLVRRAPPNGRPQRIRRRR